MSLTNEEEELDYEPEETVVEQEDIEFDEILIPPERSPSPILRLDAGLFLRKPPLVKGRADPAGKSCSVSSGGASSSCCASSPNDRDISPSNDPHCVLKVTFDRKCWISNDGPDPKGSQLFSREAHYRVSDNTNVGEIVNVGSGESSRGLTETPSSSRRRLIVSDGEASRAWGASGADGRDISRCNDQQIAPMITFNPGSLISVDGPDPKVNQLFSGRLDHPVLANNLIADGTDDVGRKSSSSAVTPTSSLKRHFIVTNEKANETQLFSNETNLAEPVIRVTFGYESGIQSDTPGTSPVLPTWCPKVTLGCSTSTSDVETRTAISTCNGQQIAPMITFNPGSLIAVDGPDPKVNQLFSGRLDHPVLASNIIADGTGDVGRKSSSSALTPSSNLKRHFIVTNEKAISQLFSNKTNLAEDVIRVPFGYESGIQSDTPVTSPVLPTWCPKVTLGCSTSTSDVETAIQTIPLSPVLPVHHRSIGLAYSHATNEKNSHPCRQHSTAPEPEDRSVAFPEVTFNPSSLNVSGSCETKASQNASAGSITYLPEDLAGDSHSDGLLSTLGSPLCENSRSAGTLPSKNTDAFSKINTNTDSRVDISQPELASKRTVHPTVQQRSIITTFSPTSLIFTSDPLPMADANLAKSTHDLTSGNSEVASRQNMVSFEAVGSDVNKIDKAPTENGSKRFKPGDQAGSSITSYGLHGVGNILAPSDKPRSILRKPQPQQENANEKLVSECLKLLCKTAYDDREQTYSLIRRSVSDVFTNLCFEQFFQRGECFSSTCEDNHHYKPHVFSHPKDRLWYASLYVICHAAQPNLQIVENLIHHYITKGNMIRTLVFAKCIARVRDIDRLELAHYIINILSGIIPRRDIITVILMLNFSELSTFQYNLLMEGLGVFEQNTTHYSELMAFLNFRGCLIPVRPLAKLMNDAIDYLDGKSDMVESISGFLGRLPPRQMNEIQSVAEKFLEKFGISLDRNYVNQIAESNESVIETQKRKIQFAAKPHIREFEVFTIPDSTHECDEPVSGEFSDDEHSGGELETTDFYNSPNLRTDAIVRVFGESCCTWILTGDCPDPICRLIHHFTKESLVGLPSEDVYLAADFVVNQAVNPTIGILKIFIEFLAESNETARVLQFRKCASKLSTEDSLALTNLVISLLAKQIGHWEAIQKVLVPDVVESGDSSDGHQFLFDHKLIQSVMSEAILTKTSLLRCVTHAILQQVGRLPPSKELDFIDTTSRFTEKFVITGRNLPRYPDILPIDETQREKFESHLKVALYQGVPNKYFLATAMLKLSIGGSLRDQALDVLYTFLLSNYDRARILTRLLENCRYFDADDRKSVIELFGAVGLSTSIRLYEGENIKGAADMFIVLKTFKFDIFSLLESHGNMTELNLAVIYCSVIADTVHRNDTIDIFLKHCVSAAVKSSALPTGLVTLTAKMFWVFTSARSVEALFKLYNGIVTRQRSLLTPLNIVDYVEPTLRCAFHGPCDEKLRRETLKLYLDVVDSGSPITFQKVTHRSALLLALMEITHATLKSQAKGYINIIHPLVKKILIKCINEGAYPEFSPSQITLFTSMTVQEIKVYMLWWFFLFVRARKRQSIDYFTLVKVAIVQDCIQDDSRLPVHQSLRSVNSSITDSAQRLALFIRQTIPEPLPPYANRGRGLFELDPAVVRGLTQTAINLMIQHGYIDSEFDRMCTFCFDKLNVDLADKL